MQFLKYVDIIIVAATFLIALFTYKRHDILLRYYFFYIISAIIAYVIIQFRTTLSEQLLVTHYFAVVEHMFALSFGLYLITKLQIVPSLLIAFVLALGVRSMYHLSILPEANVEMIVSAMVIFLHCLVLYNYVFREHEERTRTKNAFWICLGLTIYYIHNVFVFMIPHTIQNFESWNSLLLASNYMESIAAIIAYLSVRSVISPSDAKPEPIYIADDYVVK
jgi:hypothetical protein